MLRLVFSGLATIGMLAELLARAIVMRMAKDPYLVMLRIK